MSKYCKPMGLYVTYLDCMDCEDKECRQNTSVNMEEQNNTKTVVSVQSMRNATLQKGGATNMKKVYLSVNVGQDVYMVFSSKREGYTKNIVFRARVIKAIVDENGITYNCEINRCMNDRSVNINKYKKFYLFRNANIDTGYRDKTGLYYPVFTSKEGCLKWIKN